MFQTHNVPLVAPVAGFVVSLDMSGQIVSQGSLNEVLSKNERLLKEMMEEQETLGKREEVADTLQAEKDTKTGGKLVLAEEMAIGHVSRKAMKLYYSNMGGPIFWIIFILGMLLAKTMACVGSWLLGQWATEYEKRAPENVPSGFYLTIYGILLFGEGLLYALIMFMWIFGQIRVSRRYILTHMLSTSPIRLPEKFINCSCRVCLAQRCGRVFSKCRGWESKVKSSDGSIQCPQPVL